MAECHWLLQLCEELPLFCYFFVLFFLHSRVLFTVHTEAPGQKGRQRWDACLMR